MRRQAAESRGLYGLGAVAVDDREADVDYTGVDLAAFPGFEGEERDGIRRSSGDDWVHVRPSGTEPIVRIIAESPDEARTRVLVDAARRALAGSSE